MEKQIVKVICECAKMYDTNLKGKNLMFIFENRQTKKIEFIETQFLSSNFKHLTGVEYKDKKTSTEFFQLCLKNKLSYKKIIQKQNGTTRLKLEILPQLVKIGKNAKIVADYDNSKVNLYTEKLIGNIRCCIGFVKKGQYYLPNTIMKQDIRQITKGSTWAIIAILEKTRKESKYSKITYNKNNVNIKKIENFLQGKISENLYYDK